MHKRLGVRSDRKRRLSLARSVAGLLVCGCALAAGGSGYEWQGSWAVGGEGKWDLLTIDAAHNRLFIPRETRVQAIDLDSGKIVGEVNNTSGVHGVAVAPEFKRGFTSNGDSDSVTVFDLDTLAPITVIKISGHDPDAILYDPYSKHVYVFNGHSSDTTVIDAATAKVVGHISLPGRPEFAVTDANGRIFVNLEDKSTLATIEVATNVVQSNWELTSCKGPTGLAFDVARHRLFSVCANQRLVVTDSESGRHVAELPIGTHADAAAFDPNSGTVFSSNGDSADITIVEASTADDYKIRGSLKTARGSKTMALDARTHRLFVPERTPTGFQVLVAAPIP
jgi:YVTN family beta-propeller protein